VKNEIELIDTSIEQRVAALKAQRRLLDSTLIMIAAKYGQAPVDSSRYLRGRV
jgi:hypothetical protein